MDQLFPECRTRSTVVLEENIWTVVCIFISFLYIYALYFIIYVLAALGPGCWAAFPLVAARGGYSLVAVCSFSLWWLLLWSPGSGAHGLQWLWDMGFVVLRHVGSSQTRDLTCVSCIARQILNHWTTRESVSHSFKTCRSDSLWCM